MGDNPTDHFYPLLVRAIVQTYAKDVGGDRSLVLQADILGAYCIEHDDRDLCIAFAKSQPCRSDENVAQRSKAEADADDALLRGLGLVSQMQTQSPQKLF